MTEIKPVFYVDATTLRCRTMDDISDESVLYYRRGDKVHETDVALYPESAIEALQKENAELKEAIKKQSNAVNAFYAARSIEDKNRDGEIIRLRSLDADNKGLKECNAILTEENAALQKENTAQAKRIEELEAGVVDIRDWTARWTRPDHPIVTVANRLLAASKNGE